MAPQVTLSKTTAEEWLCLCLWQSVRWKAELRGGLGRRGWHPARGRGELWALASGRGGVNRLGSVLCVGGGRLSEVEQPPLFAEETDKAWYCRLSNVSLVPFWRQTGPSSIHL